MLLIPSCPSLFSDKYKNFQGPPKADSSPQRTMRMHTMKQQVRLPSSDAHKDI